MLIPPNTVTLKSLKYAIIVPKLRDMVLGRLSGKVDGMKVRKWLI